MVIQIDGRYFHTAWVTSYDGTGFSLTPYEDAMYVGKLTNDSPEEISDFHAYSWYLIVPGTDSEQIAAEFDDIRGDIQNAVNSITDNMTSNEEQTGEARRTATDYISDDGTTAAFGETFESVTVGDPTSGHIAIESNGVSVKNGSTDVAFLGNTGNNYSLNFVDSANVTQYKKDGLSIIDRATGNEVSLTPGIGLSAGLTDSIMVTEELLFSATSIAAEGYKEGTVSISKPGYYPVAISGWSSGTRYFGLVRAYISSASVGSGTLNYMVANHHSSAHSASVTAYVLWVRGV